MINVRITLATAIRILRQLRHDDRTIGLLLGVPSVLLTLVYFMFEDRPLVFDRVGLTMLGVFPFVTMFVVTSVAMLRERTTGTLERLLSSPIGKVDLLFGYGAAFSVVAVVQAAVVSALAYWVLGLDSAGSPGLVVLIAVANSVLGVALGLLCSAFARSEFQAVQFVPAVVLPQVLLCGLFVPRDEMAGWLQAVSDVLPLTYAIESLREVGLHADPTGTMWRDLAVVVAAALTALVLGATTLRRRSA
jgi:ABC-2 type transport system permease protein